MNKVFLGLVILGIWVNGVIYADAIDTLSAEKSDTIKIDTLKPGTVKSDTILKNEPIDEESKEELYQQLKGLMEEEKEDEEEKEELDIASICELAKQDAQADVSSIMWLGAGVLTSATAVLVAYIYSPNPPASRLLGKSPEYAAYYTECYTKEAKRVQTRNATMGCIAPAAVYVVCCLLGSYGSGDFFGCGF
ncbi:MAG: hypothetical protein HY769_07970 [Candidatus Stahlbacteria bacterium]|nr:hypothetical protein [Candidatus Stahlbacteria bacterium]